MAVRTRWRGEWDSKPEYGGAHVKGANGWAGLLLARAAGYVIGHSARQSEIGVMMMQWR